MKEIYNAAEAARYIGCTPQKVRERMKRKLWDLGDVIQRKELGNNQMREYNIYRYKLEKFIGKSLEEKEAELAGNGRIGGKSDAAKSFLEDTV